MRDIHVRLVSARPGTPELEQILEHFTRISEESHLDVEVLGYPRTSMLMAYDRVTLEPLMYVPVHPVWLIESLGPTPDLKPTEFSIAMGQIVKTMTFDAYREGVAELYFPCTDERVNKLAGNHGFIRQNYQTTENVNGKPTNMLRDMPFMKFKVIRKAKG